MRIQAPHPRIGFTMDQGVKVDDLIKRMDPGIGSACTDCGMMRSRKSKNRSLELILNRTTRRLSLPSQPITTVVGNAQRNAWHVGSAQTTLAQDDFDALSSFAFTAVESRFKSID